MPPTRDPRAKVDQRAGSCCCPVFRSRSRSRPSSRSRSRFRPSPRVRLERQSRAPLAHGAPQERAREPRVCVANERVADACFCFPTRRLRRAACICVCQAPRRQSLGLPAAPNNNSARERKTASAINQAACAEQSLKQSLLLSDAAAAAADETQRQTLSQPARSRPCDNGCRAAAVVALPLPLPRATGDR